MITQNTKDFGLQAIWDQSKADQEWRQGLDKLASIGASVSLFGSARIRSSHPYYQLARTTAATLGKAGFSIVTGGGPGLMEAANRGARDVGARSIGLNILLPGSSEPANRYLDISIKFQYFFVRKLVFMRYASAYVALPGGFGTLDELFECITLIQTRKTVAIPVIMVNRGFWSGIMSWIEDTLLANGAVRQSDINRLILVDDPAEICDVIQNFDATKTNMAASQSQ